LDKVNILPQKWVSFTYDSFILEPVQKTCWCWRLSDSPWRCESSLEAEIGWL